MSLYTAGSTVTVNGVAVKLLSWPANDQGTFTWVQYLDHGTEYGTSNTATATVATVGAVAGTAPGLTAPKTASHGHGANNVGSK